MKYLMILLLISITLIGCTSADSDSNGEFGSMSSADAYELIASGDDVIILDVRSEGEFSNGHIEGAILLPVDEIEYRAESILPDKDAVILVICQSGNRSQVASQELVDLGFNNVYDIGGIMSWPGEIVQ